MHTCAHTPAHRHAWRLIVLLQSSCVPSEAPSPLPKDEDTDDEVVLDNMPALVPWWHHRLMSSSWVWWAHSQLRGVRVCTCACVCVCVCILGQGERMWCPPGFSAVRVLDGRALLRPYSRRIRPRMLERKKGEKRGEKRIQISGLDLEMVDRNQVCARR